MVFAFLLAGCDSSSSTPTSPSGSLQITAPRIVLRAGDTQTLTVSGVSTSPVTWTSSDNSVVSVSASGLATAGRAGAATITATSGGASGSLSLRVASNYQGTWTGGLNRLQLTCATGSTSPPCVSGASTTGTVTLRVEQIGDQVTATLVDSAEPSVQVPLVGQVQTDDQLALAGRLDVPATTPTLRVEVASLRAGIDVTPGSLNGTYQWLVDRAPASGGSLQSDYRAQVQFRNLTR
ncbi:MAG: Ig-like domain-containing protein [Acidobacteria bacterium]|nr:Ig-like domain-containing protein [Acidobacteriota bacterium]